MVCLGIWAWGSLAGFLGSRVTSRAQERHGSCRGGPDRKESPRTCRMFSSDCVVTQLNTGREGEGSVEVPEGRDNDQDQPPACHAVTPHNPLSVPIRCQRGGAVIYSDHVSAPWWNRSSLQKLS